MNNCRLAGKVFQLHLLNTLTCKKNFAVIGFEIFRHKVEKRTFAATVCTDKGCDFALLDFEVQAVNDFVVAV